MEKCNVVYSTPIFIPKSIKIGVISILRKEKKGGHLYTRSVKKGSIYQNAEKRYT